MQWWWIAEGVAWVGQTDRVALIDTRDAGALPMLVPPPFADLWRHVAEAPRSRDDLVERAVDLMGEDAAALVDAFCGNLAEVDLLVSAPGAA